MSRSSKRIVCRVRLDDTAKVVEFTWSEGSASFKPYALYGEQVDDFRSNVQAARASLFALVRHHERRIEDRDLPEYEGACHELAECGHNLYNQVFDRAARDGEHVEQISTWLRDITETGQVESLEIVCDGQPWFAPWNLVYDEQPEEVAFRGAGGLAAFAPFWGMRYNICGGQPVDPLRRMPLPTKPHVLIVLDPVVLDGLGTYTDKDGLTQRDRLEQFLSSQGLTPVTSSAALAKALKQDRPHVIYWLGHADPDALHLGPERIDQTALRNVLRNMKRIPGQTGGLVFLNACRTAESGDLGSFLKTFHNAEFSGLIGTEEQTLDSFANPFGLGVLERFFTPGTSIGGILRGLRQSHGPLGLLYGAYCPPDLHVRAEDEPGARGQICQIEELTGAGGHMLGASRTDVVEAETVVRDQPLPEDPYLPLGAYGPEHRALFDGRDDDVARFAMILDRPETRVLVLHGESGVGKTSFLRAGLIPYLEEDCIGYRFLRDYSDSDHGERTSPVLFIRATDDPAGQIARAIVEFAAKPLEYPTPKGETVNADLPAALALALGTTEPPTAAALSERLLADPSLLSQVLARLSRPLPVTPVLVIDQAEEMFTLARSPDEDWGRGRVLEMIRQVGDRRGDFKLIVSLRTEYYGRLVSALRRGLSEADGVREYLLADLDVPAMVRVIRRPTFHERLPHAEEIPFEKYRGFDFAEGVPESIAGQVARHGRTDGVALLLQVICAQLFERAMARDDHRVTEDDLRAIGGFEGALSRHVKRQIERLLPGNSAHVGFNAQLDNLHRIVTAGRPAAEFLQAARTTVATLRDPRTDSERFQVLLTHLTLRQVDGTLTTGLLHENALRKLWDGQTAFDALLPRACDLRLLRTTTRRLDEGSDERLASLGHDALAKVAHPWKQELERRAERRKWRIRGVLAAAAATIFAGLSLAALQERNWAVRSENQARTKEANAREAEQAARAAFLSEAQEREKAVAERRRAEEALLATRTAVYSNALKEADRAWLLNDLPKAIDTLDACPVEQRRWEWQFLRRLYQGGLLTLEGCCFNPLGVAFSPDGKRLATGCSDKAVRVWDPLTGQVLLSLTGHTEAVFGVAFSPDGKRLASTGWDQTVRVWDTVTGKESLCLRKHKDKVYAVAFSPDGKRLASAGLDRTVRVWDAASGDEKLEFHRHPGAVVAVAFSPDGRRIISSGDQGSLMVWNAESGDESLALKGHTGFVEAVAFSPDGRIVASGGRDLTVRIWDSASGRELRSLRGHAGFVRAVAFSPDGQRLASCSHDWTIRVWDVGSGRVLLTLRGHPNAVVCLAYSPDGCRLASGSFDGTAKIWDATSESQCRTLSEHDAAVVDVAFSPDGSRLVSGGADSMVHLWDANTGLLLDSVRCHAGKVTGLAFSPDGRWIASSGEDRLVRFWHARGLQEGHVFQGHTEAVTCVAFSPDGKRLASGSADQSVRLWDPNTGKEETILRGHTDRVQSVTFSPDGRYIASAGWDKTIKLWDSATTKELRTLHGHTDWIYKVIFSPDSRRLVSAGEDNLLKVWDVTSGQELLSFKATLEGGAYGLAFSPDGTRLALACEDQTVRLRDADTAQETYTLRGHRDAVRSAIFSPDGKRLASAGDDKTIKIWDATPRDDKRVTVAVEEK